MTASKLPRCLLALASLAIASPAFAQVIYTYDNTTALAIPDNGCPTFQTRSFTVTETFNVGGSGTIALGVDITHSFRGDLDIRLTAPNGAVVNLQAVSGDGNDNLRATFTSNADTGNVVNDGDADPVVAGGSMRYRRLITVAALDTFYSGPANGTWTLSICDDEATDTGTLNSARLTLRNAAATAPAVCASTSSYDWAANGEEVPFASTAVGSEGLTLTQISTSGEAPNDAGTAAERSFVTRTTTTGADTGYYTLRMDTTGDTETTVESVLFGLSVPVSGLQFSLLDVDRSAGSGWEDYVQVEASGPTGRVPYQAVLVNTANTAYAGDLVETDLSAASASTDGNVTYRFLAPVSSVRINYAQGNEPNTDSVFQFIGVGDFSLCQNDYADGPASYGTLLANNGPRHNLVLRDRLFIGAAGPDGETNATASAGATGDNTSLNNDESGSITFPAPRLPNQGWVCGAFVTNPARDDYCVTVNVTNNSGTAAQLVGWIDFNNDGDFTDPGERSLPELASIATTGFNTGNIPNGTTGASVVLVFARSAPIPNNAAASVARLRLTTDPLFFSDVTPPSHLGAVSNGEVEDHAIPINTLPVTLAGFSATRLDSERVSVRWSVATEAGTVGYRLYQGSDARALRQVSPLIAARGVDSLMEQSYTATISAADSSPLYLEEIAAHGKTERFGPFAIGSTHGESLVYSEPPVASANAERQQAQVSEDQARRTLQTVSPTPAVDVLVRRSGLQRVDLGAIESAGLSLQGRDASRLQLSVGGRAVPFAISGDGQLRAGNHLEFYGEAVDSLYTDTRPYRLSYGLGQGTRWDNVSAAPTGPLAAEQGLKRFALDADRHYSFSAPGADPWYYDTVQRNGAAGAKTYSLATPGVAAAEASLRIALWGGIDMPGEAPDHHYRVSLNGQTLGERRFDGVREDEARFALPAGLLRDGNNEIRIELLDTGYAIDILRVEAIEIAATARLDAQDTALGYPLAQLQGQFDTIATRSFEAVEPSPRCGLGCEQVKISGLPDADVLALLVQGNALTRLSDVALSAEGGGYSARLRLPGWNESRGDDEGQGPRLLLLSRSQAHSPALRPALASVDLLSGGAAQLLIVAPTRYHEALAPLVQARRAEGLSVRVVDVAQIYEHYGQGMVDPQAIQRFIRIAHQRLGTRYVLLAGGDTYDPLNRLGLNSVSDIPTFYGRTHAVVNHAPMDSRYADIDDDGAPDLALGRLPVRTAAELSQAVQRILQRATSNLGASAVYVAERSNPAEGSNYAAEMDAILGSMPAAWQSAAQRVYLDQYPSGASGVAQARSAVLSSLQAGRSLLAYFGHGSPTVWSREQLLQAAQLPGLLNLSSAPVVAEFGCWGGYFVAPQYNTMAHAWMSSSANGAAAMFASGGLTEHHSDRRMAENLLPRLSRPGVRLGDALLESKRSLHASEPELKDIVEGLMLFGDPSMRM